MAKVKIDRQSEQSIRTLVRTIVHEELTDVLAELNAEKLQESIVSGRTAYKQGKTVPYRQLRQTLELD